MKKILLAASLILCMVVSAGLGAFEISFRNGPVIGVSDWNIDTQYKLGLNFAGTKKGAASGFYSSTSLDLSVLANTTAIWLQPEFQYDIKLGSLPLYIYPKLGLDIFFAWLPGDAMSLGLGIKPAVGVKFDIFESLFLWAEPFALDIIFSQYIWNDVTDNGWYNTTVMAYEMMFGVGFRL